METSMVWAVVGLLISNDEHTASLFCSGSVPHEALAFTKISAKSSLGLSSSGPNNCLVYCFTYEPTIGNLENIEKYK